MKKLLLTMMILCLISANSLLAQTITNNSFENWTKKMLYEYPESYFTSNTQLMLMNLPANVTKTTDKQQGSYAAKLETMASGTDTIQGIMLLGAAAFGQSSLAGVPYTERPTSLTGFAKYNINPGDTGAILVMFKRMGMPIGIGALTFYGSQTSYTVFNIPIQFFVPVVMPDSMVMIVTSSSLDGNRIPGSVLLIDDLKFTGATAQIPNGDMESWISVESEEPDNWMSSNFFSLDASKPSVTKSTDAYDGTYAVSIKSELTFFGDTMGFITNGRMGGNLPSGGLAIFENPDKIKGYYKYAPVGNDTAFAAAFLYTWDQSLNLPVLAEEAYSALPPASTYTPFEISFSYDKWPIADTVNISFASGNFLNEGRYSGYGSTLLIDQLTITYKTSDIEEFVLGSGVNLYPNPSFGQVNIDLNENFEGNVEIRVINAKGQLVKQENVFNEGNQTINLDIQEFEKGYYIIQIIGSKYMMKEKVFLN